ncbi:MAG: hypothetical protein HKN04_07565, partial [Rhodothermaceae bacterium]|nr:hypothetical protein [Rhodothermaceae bacterium]
MMHIALPRSRVRLSLFTLLVVSLLLLGGAPVAFAQTGSVDSTALPLIDMPPGVDYFGFEGGLYTGS